MNKSETKFWDPREENGWLSNLWKAPIVYKTLVYDTSEHLYQSLKCSNPEDAERIRLAPTAKAAKNLAHKIAPKNTLEQKVIYMRLATHLKYKQHPTLRRKLRAIKGLIIENSPTDSLWGNANNGINLMGMILTEYKTKHLS